METIKPEIAQNYLKKSSNIRYHWINPSNSGSWDNQRCSSCNERYGNFNIAVENRSCGHFYHYHCYMDIICSVSSLSNLD